MPVDGSITDQCGRALSILLWGLGAAGVVCSAGVSPPALADTASAGTEAADLASTSLGTMDEVTVTAERLELLGTASTASEGVVSR